MSQADTAVALKISYLKRNHADEPLIPTPNGLMLVAGNPVRAVQPYYRFRLIGLLSQFRRQLGNTPADRAVVFDCRDKLGEKSRPVVLDPNAEVRSEDHTNDPAWNLRNDFFPHACPSSLVAWIVFPACCAYDPLGLTESLLTGFYRRERQGPNEARPLACRLST